MSSLGQHQTGGSGVEVALYLDALGEHRLEEDERALESFDDVGLLVVGLVEADEPAEAGDELVHAGRRVSVGLDHRAQRLLHRRFALQAIDAALEHREVAVDDAERGVDLVGEAGGDVAEQRRLLRLDQVGLGLLELGESQSVDLGFFAGGFALHTDLEALDRVAALLVEELVLELGVDGELLVSCAVVAEAFVDLGCQLMKARSVREGLLIVGLLDRRFEDRLGIFEVVLAEEKSAVDHAVIGGQRITHFGEVSKCLLDVLTSVRFPTQRLVGLCQLSVSEPSHGRRRIGAKDLERFFLVGEAFFDPADRLTERGEAVQDPPDADRMIEILEHPLRFFQAREGAVDVS